MIWEWCFVAVVKHVCIPLGILMPVFLQNTLIPADVFLFIGGIFICADSLPVQTVISLIPTQCLATHTARRICGAAF